MLGLVSPTRQLGSVKLTKAYKTTPRKTLHLNTRGMPQNKSSKSAALFWLDFSPLFDQFPYLGDFFQQNYLNTEAKLAVTKSVKIFIFGKIKIKLKIISYFLILQYFNVCFILINCIS